MRKPLVSIIIPVYNSEKYLAESVQSAVAQTWQNKEVIIVDDGSTDSSFEIASQFTHPSIKIFKQGNKGASAARNRGLMEASGQYIQFLDADDLISPNKIEVQVGILEKSKDHLVLSDTVYFADGNNPYSAPAVSNWYATGSYEPLDFLIKLYGGDLAGNGYGGMVTVHSWLTPRDLIEKAGLWNEQLTVDDDGEFFCRVILACKGVCYASDTLNYYRKYTCDKSLSSQKSYPACRSILKATDLKTAQLLNRTNDHLARTICSRLYWENSVSFYPKHIKLALEAEKKAKQIAPDFNFNPFKNGLNLKLSKLVGWKAIRYLQYLKNSMAT